ncbi:NAD(P)-dependent oxidoreductase [Saccharothrix xinjiangensis]|uniref:NAD(P)-dependent oxidoreductase n=1 Tax=Saccharothrix xinjiangensis TaxID=204798 RepID=A0ABV9YA71_9PSEU
MLVALLGTGLMGAGMARSLLRAGLDVVVWNRSADKARPLAEAGAAVAEDPATAVQGADVVLTMLFDADATAEVMAAALPSLKPLKPSGARPTWVQCATVGLDGGERLARLAAEHDVGFVDAPVLGTRQPAEQGKLTVLAAAPPRLRAGVEPVFEAIAARTAWAGERPGDGQRLKLVANAWVLSITAAAAQSVALARGLGLDPSTFLDAIAGGPVDSAYAQAKGRAMIDHDFTPSFGVDGAAKDSSLIADAMNAAGTDDRLMRVLLDHYRTADDGAPADMAAVVRAFGR